MIKLPLSSSPVACSTVANIAPAQGGGQFEVRVDDFRRRDHSNEHFLQFGANTPAFSHDHANLIRCVHLSAQKFVVIEEPSLAVSA